MPCNIHKAKAHLPKFDDLSGKRFGRLTVISRAENRTGRSAWLCGCECGKNRIVLAQSLKNGSTVSCGCYGKEIFKNAALKHGHARASGRSPEYSAWQGMIQRCTNKSCAAYRHYGGRGIKVCDRWLNFENFIADIGMRPEGYTLERKNNMMGYCKENCEWTTRKNQARNTRRNRLLELDGVKATMPEWSERTGLTVDTIRNRFRNGWSVEETLSIPSDDKRLSVAKTALKIYRNK